MKSQISGSKKISITKSSIFKAFIAFNLNCSPFPPQIYLKAPPDIPNSSTMLISYIPIGRQIPTKREGKYFFKLIEKYYQHVGRIFFLQKVNILTGSKCQNSIFAKKTQSKYEKKIFPDPEIGGFSSQRECVVYYFMYVPIVPSSCKKIYISIFFRENKNPKQNKKISVKTKSKKKKRERTPLVEKNGMMTFVISSHTILFIDLKRK